MNVPPGFLAAALVAAGGGSEGLARTATVQLPPGLAVRGAELADLDGDALPDLVVAASSVKNGDSVRHLLFYPREPKTRTFGAAPAQQLELTADAVAYALADVHVDPGSELVLFAPGGVFCWRPGAEARARFTRLFETELLWQIPEDNTIYSLQERVSDIDGDGLVDLLVPEPDGYRIALQRRGPDGVTFALHELRVPLESDPERSGFHVSGASGVSSRDDRHPGFELEIRVGSNDPDPALFRVTERVPGPLLADWDADGDLDLLGQGARQLHVWLQASGAFAADPEVSLALPVATAERRLDVSYSTLAIDVDLDRRVDCLILAGDKRSRDVRTQLQVFTQAATPPLFGEQGLPRQLLVLAGFAGQPSLDDVNGDKRPDLVIGSLRPDLIDSLRSASSKRLDVELYVYLNGPGGFSKTPDIAHDISIPVDVDKVVTRFFGDVTGDGLSDLFTRHEPERLRVLMTRRERDGRWTIHGKPVWELSIDPSAVITLTPGAEPRVLVLEPAQVLLAEFGGQR